MSLRDLGVRLQPAMTERQEIQNSAGHLANTLSAKANEGQIPPSLEIHFIGSFARGTKPSPVDDVDLLCVIGEARQHTDNWHTITRNSFSYATEDYEPDGNLSSVRLLNRIKTAITATYPNSDLRRNHEVVSVHLSSYDRSFDLVPAWSIPEREYFLIPQGEQKHRWKKTNPFRDKDILGSLDQKTSSTATPAILIMKHWFSRKQIVTPRSYHLEALAYNVLTDMTEPTASLLDTLAMLLNNFDYRGLLASCPDPTGLSEPLKSGLAAQDISKITSEGKRAALILKTHGENAFLETINEQ